LTVKGKEAFMLALRPAACVLLAGLLAGCSLYSYDYRLWH